METRFQRAKRAVRLKSAIFSFRGVLFSETAMEGKLTYHYRKRRSNYNQAGFYELERDTDGNTAGVKGKFGLGDLEIL